MDRRHRYLAILAQSDASVQQAAGQAFRRLLDLIRQGNAPRTAIDQILREFNADTVSGFREAFSAVLESSLGEKTLKAWPVGGVKLSQRLYQNAQQVSATAKTLIEQHLKGLHNAQELRKALYEGYNFQDDPLKIIKPLPKYLQVEFDKFKAAQLKTPALRAAYLEAIRKAEAGAGMDAIEKQLRIAFYERNRYFANRIARTELHRAYTDQQARELMEQERIQYVQIRLSSQHPKTDICDYHAKVDLYGLGPGVYPKAEAPKPPFHPHCYCLTAPRIDLINPKPRFNPHAERTFLATLPAKEAAQVAGSFEKRRRILEDKESLEGIYNQGKDPLYQWRRMGEMMETSQVKATRLSSKAMDTALADDEKLTIPARVHPVSQAFDFPDEPEYAPIRRALAAIDAAHDDGDLPPLPIELARDLDLEDDGEYWSDGLRALKIRVSARSKVKEFALACETGHFLDHQALAPGQGFASLVPDGLLAEVLRTIRSSQAYAEWNRESIDFEGLSYFNDPTEMWSRAYAQWAARKSGSSVMKSQVDQAIDREYGYWKWDDFEPIEQEIEKVFHKRGWL